MARQTYYVTREQKHPLYRTRMLQAGPLELDASAARLYRNLGVELTDEAPKQTKVTGGSDIYIPDGYDAGDPSSPQPQVIHRKAEAPKPAAKKAAPKRRRKK